MMSSYYNEIQILIWKSFKVFSLLIKTSVLCLCIFLLTPGNHWSFYCLHSFAFSRMAFSWNLFFCFLSPWQVQSLFKTTHGRPDQNGSRWQAPWLSTAALLPISSPVPLVLPSSHMEVNKDTVWIFVHWNTRSFCASCHSEPRFLSGGLQTDEPFI